jgi:hypothetical protein
VLHVESNRGNQLQQKLLDILFAHGYDVYFDPCATGAYFVTAASYFGGAASNEDTTPVNGNLLAIAAGRVDALPAAAQAMLQALTRVAPDKPFSEQYAEGVVTLAFSLPAVVVEVDADSQSVLVGSNTGSFRTFLLYGSTT